MATPAAPLSNSGFAKDWTWLNQHLILLAIVALIIFGGVYGVESIIAKHDATRAAQDSAILAQQTATTKALADQLQSDESQWSKVQAQLLAQNTQLSQAIAARNQQIATLVKTDATLSAEQAASKISIDLQAEPGEVTPSGNSVALDLPVARRVVSSLDQLPVVEANLTDTQKQLANETTVATNAQTDAKQSQQVIASQQTQIADQTKACNAQIAALKSQNRKSKIKSFLLGAATALVALAGHSI
jgi:uncharacterized phage infection (PIP) family protein YhgE